MGELSKIGWCHHSFAPWVGCKYSSPACLNCYAEAWAKRFGRDVWTDRDRERTSNPYWNNIRRINRRLNGTGRRETVFMSHLSDIFDQHPSIKNTWRFDVWALVRECCNLDWLILTKRIKHAIKFLPEDWGDGYENVAIGVTVENQDFANARVPRLLDIPAKMRFVSCEPLLGPVDLRNILLKNKSRLDALDRTLWTPDEYDGVTTTYKGGKAGIDWVITGGENAPDNKRRRTDLDWYRSLRDQCQATDVAFYFKQHEGPNQPAIVAKGRELDGQVWDEYPAFLAG